MPEEEERTRETVDHIVLVCNSETDLDPGNATWHVSLTDMGFAQARSTGLELRRRFRQIGIIGTESNIVWVRSALGSARDTAWTALHAVNLPVPGFVEEARLNAPREPMETFSADTGLQFTPSGRAAMEQAAQAVLQHHAQAHPIVKPDSDKAARVTVVFGHASLWRGVMPLLWPREKELDPVVLQTRPQPVSLMEHREDWEGYAWRL